MKKTMGSIFGFSALLFSLAVFAADENNDSLQAPYLGISAGAGGLDVHNPLDSEIQRVSFYQSHKKSFATRIFTGYLWDLQKIKNLKLGFELGYLFEQNNKLRMNDQSWKYGGFNIDYLGIARYNIAGSRFFLIAKAGLVLMHQTVDLEYSIPAHSSRYQLAPEVGGGFGFDLPRNFEINVTATHAYGKHPDSVFYGNSSLVGVDRVMPVNTALLGVVYYFK
jgi:hypothetical protein